MVKAAGDFAFPGVTGLLITRGDGLIDRDQAAALAGVTPDAVTMWATRGYWLRDRSAQTKLPVAKREGRKPLYSVVEVQKAEWHTRLRGRRATAGDLQQAA